MQVRFIVCDMKCAVGRKGVFYEVFQMAADIGRVPILKRVGAGLIKKRWMRFMRI